MTIDNTEDTLNSTDIIERIEELETDLIDKYNESASNEDKTIAEVGMEVFNSWIESITDDEEAQEYKTLKAFASELEGYGDWKHGEILIRESFFEDYCKELLEDTGELPKDLPSYIVIDWEETANNLRVDYTEAELDGVTYLMRA